MECNKNGCSCNEEHEAAHCGCCHEKHEHSHGEADICGCGHCHGEEEKGALPIVLTAVGAAAIAATFLPFINVTVKSVILALVAVVCGLPVFADAVKSLRNKKIGETVLMLIAVVAALLLGEFFEAAVVTVLFRAGELMDEYASGRSKRSIEALFSIVSDKANLVMPDGSFKKIDADEIEKGSVLAVLPHEIIPADGIIISGESTVDESALTGESLPVEVSGGSCVRSGTLNGDSTIIIEASAGKAQSSAARVVEMVEQAAMKKGNAQRAVSVFAKYYTPAIIAAATLVAIVPSIMTGDWALWIKRSLILLVAACPCAVVISVPLAFFSSMGAAAKNGMIIKGSSFIETLAKADTAVFDKTGTLTTGKLSVGKIYCKNGVSSETVLALAAKCESCSSHPIAAAIVDAAGETDISGCSGFSETAGGGTCVDAPEGRILCGGERLMKHNGIDISELPNSPVYVALNGEAMGAIEIDGEVRSDSAQTVEKLRRLGIENTMILTGDNAGQARKICSACRIDDFRSGLLPEDKLTELEDIKERSKGVIYVGDGINDAPVLAAADVGIAMGLGTQAACEAADVILTNSVFSRLADTVYQCKRTMRVLKTNIAFAVIVKIAVIALGIAGIAPMWSAILADVGTMIICVANSARLLKVKRY